MYSGRNLASIMDVDKLIDEVIPPKDYQHRNGFSNIPIINRLSIAEKQLLERALIQKVQLVTCEEIDTLVIETLGYFGDSGQRDHQFPDQSDHLISRQSDHRFPHQTDHLN